MTETAKVIILNKLHLMVQQVQSRKVLTVTMTGEFYHIPSIYLLLIMVGTIDFEIRHPESLAKGVADAVNFTKTKVGAMGQVVLSEQTSREATIENVMMFSRSALEYEILRYECPSAAVAVCHN